MRYNGAKSRFCLKGFFSRNVPYILTKIIFKCAEDRTAAGNFYMGNKIQFEDSKEKLQLLYKRAGENSTQSLFASNFSTEYLQRTSQE